MRYEVRPRCFLIKDFQISKRDYEVELSLLYQGLYVLDTKKSS